MTTISLSQADTFAASPHERLARHLRFGIVLALLLQLGITMLPRSSLDFAAAGVSPAAVHLLMELFAVVIAALIVTITWHSFDALPRRFAIIVIAGYTVVGVSDVLHLATYHGMPPLFPGASLGQGIFFWLAGRTAEVGTLIGLALGAELAWTRARALTLALMMSLAVSIWGGWRIDWFPQTIVPGQGLTGFKVGFEAALIAANVLVGALLWRQGRRAGDDARLLMATSALTMGIGGLSFAAYSAPHDAQNLLGHVFKVAAYVLLFRATFAAGLRAPIDAMHASERRANSIERQLDRIIATATDAILIADADLRVRVFNEAAERMFGTVPAAALGRPLTDFFAPGAAVDGLGVQFGSAMELDGCRSDGSSFPIEVSVSRLGEGPDQLLTIVARDMTLTREAEQLRAARRAAEIASQAKSEFIARISHELRNPLNALIGSAQLLEHAASAGAEPLREKQALRVSLIRRAGLHLLRLVDDLLDIGRVESGQLRMQLKAVSLLENVREAIELIEPQARACGISVATVSIDSGLVVVADAARLRQVLINLLSNGIKYNRRGGGVRVEADRSTGDGIRIDVIDDGIGMNAEQLSNLFEPFNRLGRERGGVEGAGIGLALSRQLVVAMGGSIVITSDLGQGTRARLELPAALR